MKYYKIIFTSLIIILTFQNCSKHNLLTQKKIEKDFNDSIKKYKAIKFNFEEDGLVHQENYFVNSKLKFLTLRYGGESIIRNEKYIFDSKTGKINSTIINIERTNNNSESDFTDTIRIVNIKNKDVKTFVDDKLITLKNDSKFLDKDYSPTYKLKKITEEIYNTQNK